MSRLTIDITDQQHKSWKALAALEGKTIKQYALERLFPIEADADQAWQELKLCWEIASTMVLRVTCPPKPTLTFWMKSSTDILVDGVRSHGGGGSQPMQRHPL